jgi:hypothetical protein
MENPSCQPEGDIEKVVQKRIFAYYNPSVRIFTSFMDAMDALNCE